MFKFHIVLKLAEIEPDFKKVSNVFPIRFVSISNHTHVVKTTLALKRHYKFVVQSATLLFLTQFKEPLFLVTRCL